MNKAVFLDRDGVLIRDTMYPGDPDKIIFLHDIGKAIKKLNQSQFKVIVVSNQSGVARGYFTEEVVREINRRIERHVKKDFGKIDGFYYCPHHPDDNCECRKPKPGMLLKAAKEHGIDLKKSYMIGDSIRDMEAGKAAGCATILLTQEANNQYTTAQGLPEAVEIIVSDDLKKASK
jgi:histidinol-phosphate phosphatase family protein